MSVSGLCQICESAQSEDQCPSCGALVCRQHMDRSLGVCMACAQGSGQRPGGGPTYQF